MLKLQQIIITHFKNYEISSFNFKENVVGICGLNGKGKTNLLDAIYYCCFTKSYFSNTDILNKKFDKDGFRLEAEFEASPNPSEACLSGRQGGEKSKEEANVVAILRPTGKKEILINGSLYEKPALHIGKFPCVFIAPDDIELITGGSELRRRYIDTILCQVDFDYLQNLIIYNKILLQRNSLLKGFAEQGKTDFDLLDIMDAQIIIPGKYIYEKRRLLLEELIPLTQNFYDKITGRAEKIEVLYVSLLREKPFEDILLKSRPRDLFLQRSSSGIHKDEISFQLSNQNFKSIASQGQRKSLLFALKLAAYQFLKVKKGFSPLLLLDDVFEKLDKQRIQNLLHWVCNENEGQVFITDTHKERLLEAFKVIDINGQIIELE